MSAIIHTSVGPGGTDISNIGRKFGRSTNIGTSLTPVSHGEVYRTPQPASATALRVKAGNANDTAAGTGAREVTIIGLDENGVEQTETLATAGTSASSNTTTTFIRLYRAYVSKSGTYASASAGSHSAAVVIENAAGTEDWLTIPSDPFPSGQSEVGALSTPSGKEAYITGFSLHVDSTKSVELTYFERANILEAAAPYSAMRVKKNFVGVSGGMVIDLSKRPIRVDELTDFGFMAKVSTGTADVSVEIFYVLRNKT